MCVAVALLGAKGIVLGQDSLWSLNQCIEYAGEHSLEIQGEDLKTKNAASQERQAEWAMAPSINASASQTFSFADPVNVAGTGQVSKNLRTTSLSVGASMTLFDGLAKLRNIQYQRLVLQGQEASRANTLANIGLAVTEAYFNVVYQAELVRTQEEQVASSKEQVELGKWRVEAGAIPQGALYDLQAQLASDEQALVNAENALSTAQLTLEQTMNYVSDTPLRISRPAIDSASLPHVPTGGAIPIYEVAMQSYPSLQYSKALVTQQEKQIQIARSRYWPELSLSATYGSSAQFYMDQMHNPKSNPLLTQLKDNDGWNLQLSLTIPIFNGFSTYEGVVRAKIAHQESLVNLRKEEKALLKNIQSAYLDAVSSWRQLLAARNNVRAQGEAFRWAKEKIAVGAISAYDYNLAKTNSSKAQVTLLQATFNYLYKVKILDFYQGKEIVL
ncbi:MAG: hypothetical protein AL399_02790 [Candidatus [Bacteroides] periocalifornicus]|uniref:Transporter n=1 Tax=Candidatus [Bacteroides] periocalifornicus TaxID=1702214 RepID=A0A0Q4BA06_9BACT|nr:MAG: hypothetical protein AL399_02790 [Candidatus [Bacteroides] periocalifornicus]